MTERYAIHLVTFPNPYLAAATFMRFQEHYESPSLRFRGRAFDAETFMDDYARRRGAMSYFEDWTGFNLPSTVLAPFYAGAFDPLTRKEQALLGLFRKRKGRFYVIGATAGDTTIVAHEFTHGLFFTVQAYREDVLATLRRIEDRPLRRLSAVLKEMGYCDAVIDDERNAYLTTGLSEEMARLRAGLAPARREMRAVFARHFGFDVACDKDCRRIMRRLHHHRFPVP